MWCLTEEFITGLLASQKWLDFLDTRTRCMPLWCLLRICYYQGKLSRNNAFCLAVEEVPCSQNLPTQYTSNFNSMLVLWKEGWQHWETRLFHFPHNRVSMFGFQSWNLPWVEYKQSSLSMREFHLLCIIFPLLPFAYMKSLSSCSKKKKKKSHRNPK